MGKIFCALLGFITFGPAGLLVGLLIGFILDSNVKNFNFFSRDNGFSNDYLVEAFPVLAAEIINAGNVDKLSILNLKNEVIGIFGTEKAKTIMAKIKYYIENGYTRYKVDEVCEYLYINADINTKINLINILFGIIKSHRTFTSREMNVLNEIAGKIGVSLNNFNYNNNGSRGYGYDTNYRTYSEPQKDFYKILEIDRSATDEQIKKQYRTLCKKFHPDRSMNLSENEKKSNEFRMKEIIDAYDEIKKERNIK
jgi:DnaJ like chaperone protein